jgi:hypothetical protein
MKTTSYFREDVLAKRPYIEEAWCLKAIREPIAKEIQPNGRIRHWVFIEEAEKFFRVVTLDDGETVHNAFFDRGFKRSK